MATSILSITIAQDNKYSGVDLLSVHNPLVFLVDASYSGDPPDNIYATLDGVTFYKCNYLEEVTASSRRFFFVADEILRAELDTVEDIVQTDGTVISAFNMTKEITLYFTDTGDPEYDINTSVTIIACNASNDFVSEYGACMVNEVNNERRVYTAGKNKIVYLYWWNDDAANVIDGTMGGVVEGSTSSDNADNMIAWFVANYPTLIATDDSKPLKIIKTTFVDSPDTWYGVKIQISTAISLYCTNISAGHNIDSDGHFSAPLSYQYLAGTFIAIVAGDDVSSNPEIVFDMAVDLGGSVSNYGVNTGFGIYDGITLDKGFIRKAITPTETGLIQGTINIAGVDYTHDIYVRDTCESSILMKYLDRSGQYRFMVFNQFYQIQNNPELIGKSEELILSLLTGKGDKKVIGYKNSDTLILNAELITEAERPYLKDLYVSSDVMVYLNNKWVSVEVSGDNISKLFKNKFSDLTITAKLPQSYNITML